MHTPEQVAASIKDIIKQKYGSLNAYAQEKSITSVQLYTLLNGKEYLTLFSAFRFSTDFDLNIDYCTKGGDFPSSVLSTITICCWKPSLINPRTEESALIQEFIGYYGERSFANLQD